MITEVFFDVETKKLFSDIASSDPGDLGVSIVSVYRRIVDESMQEITGTKKSFWEPELPDMWELFDGAHRIIGFNSIRFDVLALKPYAPTRFAKLSHFDILEKIRNVLGHSLSLNVLARDTLGRGKIDVGTNAVTYFANGDQESLTKLKTYCEDDVFLTRDLYDHIIKQKAFRYIDKWNTQRTQSIDFSYPQDVFTKQRQLGLF